MLQHIITLRGFSFCFLTYDASNQPCSTTVQKKVVKEEDEGTSHLTLAEKNQHFHRVLLVSQLILHYSILSLVNQAISLGLKSLLQERPENKKYSQDTNTISRQTQHNYTVNKELIKTVIRIIKKTSKINKALISPRGT